MENEKKVVMFEFDAQSPIEDWRHLARYLVMDGRRVPFVDPSGNGLYVVIWQHRNREHKFLDHKLRGWARMFNPYVNALARQLKKDYEKGNFNEPE